METPAYTFGLSRAVAVRLSGYGTVLFFLGLGVLAALSSQPEHLLNFDRSLFWAALICIAVYFATLVLHEGVHGFFFWLFGGRPKYGVGIVGWFMPYAYATSPGDLFTLSQMTIICLAPFVIISLGSLAAIWLVPAAATFAGVAFVTNFSGAVGDLWVVGQIWKFRGCRDLRMADIKDAMAIYTTEPAAEAIAASLAAKEAGTRKTRFVVRWTIAFFILLMSATPFAILMDLLGAQKVVVGPSRFPLFVFERLPKDGIALSVDLNSMIVAGFLFALLFLLFEPRTPRISSPNAPTPKGPPHPATL